MNETRARKLTIIVMGWAGILCPVVFDARDAVALGRYCPLGAKQEYHLLVPSFDSVSHAVARVTTNRSIPSWGDLAQENPTKQWEQYLASHPEIAFEDLLVFFDRLFPEGRPLPGSDPRYLDPNSLVDFESYQKDQPGILKILSIAEARKAIQNIISVARGYEKIAESSSERVRKKDPAFFTAYHFAVKRIVDRLSQELDLRPPGWVDRWQRTMVILASVGGHCPTEQLGGLEIALRTLQGEEKGADLEGMEESLETIVNRALFNLREQLFRKAIQFETDHVEPIHAQHYYRSRLHSRLGIAPPAYADPARKAQSNHYQVIPLEAVEAHFFQGKVGSQRLGANAEERRSHPGYVPAEMFRAIQDELKKREARLTLEHYQTFFETRIPALDVVEWAMSHAELIAATVYLEETATLSAAERLELVRSIPLNELRRVMMLKSYLKITEKTNGEIHYSLTPSGIREVLVRLGHWLVV